MVHFKVVPKFHTFAMCCEMLKYKNVFHTTFLNVFICCPHTKFHVCLSS
jgi:hypothetical protein